MNTDVILEQPDTDQIAAVNSKLRKSLPWVLGAVTVVAGTLLIRAWIRHSESTEQVDDEQENTTSSASTAKSIAFQLLPFATVLLKNWLMKDKTEKEAATA